MHRLYHQKIYSIFLLLLLCGCTPLIGPYSPTAYENATSLKAEVLAILSKANTPYSENIKEIEDIQLKAEKAYEYVKGVPKNQISAKQWEILKNPDGDLLGKFFKRWKERSTLSDTLIKEYKDLASAAFDEIICLEANKKEKNECVAEGGGNNG